MTNWYNLNNERLVGVSKLWKEKKFVITTIIFVLLFASTLIALIVIVTKEAKPESCTSIHCLKAALDLRSKIDEWIDPCDDFYEFSCRKLIEKKEDNDSLYNIYFKFLDELKDIIDKTWTSNNSTDAVKNFLDAYNSLKNYQKIENQDLEWIRILIEKIGGCPIINENWKEFGYDWEESYSKAIKFAAYNPIFTVEVFPDSRNTKRYIIGILILPSKSTDKKLLEMYRAFFPSLLTSTPLDNITKMLKELNSLDEELSQMDINDYQQLVNKTETEFMTIEKLQKFIPEVNWEKFLVYVFKDINLPTKWRVTLNTEIFITGKSYLSRFFKKVSGKVFKKRQLANYLCVNLMADLASLIPPINVSMRSLELAPSAENSLIKMTDSFAFALEYLYYQHEKSKNESEFPNEFINYLKESMLNVLSETSWLDARAREIVKDKIQNLIISTEFPEFVKDTNTFEEYYKNLPKMTSNPYENKINLEKFNFQKNLEKLPKLNNRSMPPLSNIIMIDSPVYLPYVNKVVLNLCFVKSAALLNAKNPAYINFGRFGSILAHEIIHSLDTFGITRSSVGNPMNQLPNNTKKSYDERVQCLVKQYDSYEVTKGEYINGKKTIQENIADNGGLRQAFMAYRKYVNEKGEMNSLPGFEKYTPEQLFFISYATMWCMKSSDTWRTDIHSPYKNRVIGAVSNMKEFSEIFKCEKDKPMNPKNKCVLW